MTDEIVKIENCRVAMKAALEAIQDYCGMAPTTFRVGGVEFQLPEEIHEIIVKDITPAEKINRIQREQWTKDEADKMCQELIGAKDQGKCREHMVHSIATAIVSGDELSSV